MPVDRKPNVKGRAGRPSSAPGRQRGGSGKGLGRKLGPLPLWGWGLGIAAALLLGLYLRGRAGKTGTAEANPQPGEAPGAGGGGISGLPNGGGSSVFDPSGLEDEIAALRDQIGMMGAGPLFDPGYLPPLEPVASTATDSVATATVPTDLFPNVPNEVGSPGTFFPGRQGVKGNPKRPPRGVIAPPIQRPSSPRAPRGRPVGTTTFHYFGVASTPGVTNQVIQHPYVSNQIAAGTYHPQAMAAAREEVRRQTGGHSGGGRVYAV